MAPSYRAFSCPPWRRPASVRSSAGRLRTHRKSNPDIRSNVRPTVRPSEFSKKHRQTGPIARTRCHPGFPFEIRRKNIQIHAHSVNKIFSNILDFSLSIGHPGFQHEFWIEYFPEGFEARIRRNDPKIRVYRSHAARAISEERWDVAEIFLDRILDVDPHHTEAWLMKGHLRHHCRQDERTAVDCYRKVITLCGNDSPNPHAERARTSLGRILAVWG